MINSNMTPYYFSLSNSASCGVAFATTYIAQGVPVYAYSKVIPPGTSRGIYIANDATNITFTVYVYNPPYQFITIYHTNFAMPAARCYLATGTLRNPNLSRIPCFIGDNGNNGCCCCCNCCH